MRYLNKAVPLYNHKLYIYIYIISYNIYTHLLSALCEHDLKVQGFFICHIIVIQGIIRSEMQSNQVRSVDSAK